METTNVCWDLSELFASTDDPKIVKILDATHTRAKAFEKKYRNKINSSALTAKVLLEAIKEYESIVSDLTIPACYAYLVFSADTSKPEHGALMQYVQQRESEILLDLIFFDLELLAAPADVINPILEDEVFNNYAHFVKAARLSRDYRLSECEEKILEIKSNTGARAFERLFDEYLADIKFDLTVDGKRQKLSEAQLLGYQRSDNRELRKASARSLTKGLKKNAKVFTYIFNTLAWDKMDNDKLRNYTYPQQARNIRNELEPQTVETVMSACVDNYNLVARFYNIKKKILGYSRLYHYDRYAPLFESKEKVSFDVAKGIVLKAFGEFSQLIREKAAEFFDKKRIDAQSRMGKQGGAYCMSVTPDIRPFIFMNYLNRKDDVMTLAHELGHGVHGSLSCDCQTLLNLSTALPIAELASTFGEMLVFESLVKKSDLDEKLALYAGKIEDVFSTVFRQAAMYHFESEFHAQRRERGELTTDDICEIWQKNIQKMFGNSVTLGDDHKYWWMYVSHFIGSPFYVYAYSFGELLVMSLFAMYKHEGEPFVKKFEKMLSMGGSCSTEDLLLQVGVDIKNSQFWNGGIEIIGSMIDEFEKLYKEWKNK